MRFEFSDDTALTTIEARFTKDRKTTDKGGKMRIKRFLQGLVLVAAPVGILSLVLWVPLAPAASAGDSAKGKAIFSKTCAGCHGESGKGDGSASAALNPKPKDLSDKAFNKTLDDTFLHNIITKGGAAVGKAPMMPPFAQLKPQEVDDVVAYIRSLAK
jgi:mono/diheme cytochrome c family protein